MMQRLAVSLAVTCLATVAIYEKVFFRPEIDRLSARLNRRRDVLSLFTCQEVILVRPAVGAAVPVREMSLENNGDCANIRTTIFVCLQTIG